MRILARMMLHRGLSQTSRRIDAMARTSIAALILVAALAGCASHRADDPAATPAAYPCPTLSDRSGGQPLQGTDQPAPDPRFRADQPIPCGQ